MSCIYIDWGALCTSSREHGASRVPEAPSLLFEASFSVRLTNTEGKAHQLRADADKHPGDNAQ